VLIRIPKPKHASHTNTVNLVKIKDIALLDLSVNKLKISKVINLNTSRLKRITIKCLDLLIFNKGLNVKKTSTLSLLKIKKPILKIKKLIPYSFY